MGGGQTSCPEQAQVASERATDGIVEPDGSELHVLQDAERQGPLAPSGGHGMRGPSIGMVGWTKLPENKEDPIIQALVEQGPMYVAIAAGPSWYNYLFGVMTPDGCDSKSVVNHAVVLYGYGVKNTRNGDMKYWTMKNSWGRSWGETGSIRLQRLDDEEGFCGWDSSPQLGSGCSGGPPKVWVCGSCGILYDAVVPTFAKRPQAESAKLSMQQSDEEDADDEMMDTAESMLQLDSHSGPEVSGFDDGT